MNILCLLQNAWGSKSHPIIFDPNPYNKSARQLQRMVGANNTIYFCNTTDEITEHSYDRAKPNHEHFNRLLDMIHDTKAFDMMIVCGRQAESMVKQYDDRITLRYVCIPHPNKRGMTREEIGENTIRVRDLMRDVNPKVTFE